MRKLVPLAATLVAAIAALWFASAPRRVPAALPARSPDLVNGREVFYAGGCASCHATPGQDDRTRLGGGLALKSPFGIFYAPNISPDLADGLGRWTESDFVTAVKQGTSPDNRHYYPAFPYTTYTHARLEDVRDLFAFLKTLPAVQGYPRDHEVRFPFNVRRLLGGWKLLFLDAEPFVPDPSRSAQWNRGAYLVNALAHCAECHSPRNVLGGIKRNQRFGGGPSLDGEGWVPNITQKALGEYSQDDLADLLETGHTLTDSVGGDMRAVIRNTAELSQDDRTAMATYIKSLPSVDGPKPPE